MNGTNRAANRVFVLVVGIVLTALGVAAVLLGTVPAVRAAWRSTAPGLRHDVVAAIGASVVPGSRLDWIGVGVLALLVLVVVLLVVFVARQGTGRTGTALEQRTGDDRVRVDTAVVRDLLSDALDRHQDLVASSVTSHRVRGVPVLGISATCRRGVAPTDAARVVEDAVRRLDRLLGTQVPAAVVLHGGFRARMAASARLEA